MPGKVGVKIKAGRNLPIMDRSSDTTDAYVEIKLGNITHKTEVCRKSLNPQWNTDWFRFEIDDADLQDEPLQIRLMDHDTYSANDAIGKVNISLNPLCLETAEQSNQGKGAVMSGWIPVFDTMHGIRGEVNIIVKVDLFSDANKFRQSSCGVHFFHSSCIPHGYAVTVIHGFVEELVVNDDPEYQWIDKIRTPRASNEARQVVFIKLSGQVQRKIGLKAINLGANAVIGYTQCFDLEGDVGVVARGIGTAVTLIKLQEYSSMQSGDNALIEERTLKYLEFLKCSPTTDENKSKFDLTTYAEDNDFIDQILGFNLVDKSSTCTPNVMIKRNQWKPVKNNIIQEESNGENNSVRALLQQEDQRGEKTTKTFRHHVKRFKKNSKTLLSEKFNVFKGQKNLENKTKLLKLDTRSLSSSFSDLSFSDSTKISLTDLRNLMEFRKERKQQQYKRSASDGTNMASLLISSILHGPSLDSISEYADDSNNSKANRTVRTECKTESMTNLLPSSFEEKLISNYGYAEKNVRNINEKNLIRVDKKKRPTSLPKITSDKDMSISSTSISLAPESLSSSSSSTSDEVEGASDEMSEDTALTPAENAIDPDTISMVVKSALAIDEQNNNRNQAIKINEENSTNKQRNEIENFSENIEFERSDVERINSLKLDSQEDTKFALKENMEVLTTGNTKVLQKDKNAHILCSEIVANETNVSKLGLLIKRPSIDLDEDNWIEPGSTVDEPETVDLKRRGSVLHNLTEKLHHLQEHMHLPHFFEDKSKIIHKHGLVESAMESMLVEQASLLGAGRTDCIADEIDSQESSNEPDQKRDVETLKKTSNQGQFTSNENKKHHEEIKNEYGLLGTAMKTMLMDALNFSEEIGHNSYLKTPGSMTKIHEDNAEISKANINLNENNVSESNEVKDICRSKSKSQEIDINFKALSHNTLPQLIKLDDNYFYSSEPEINHAMTPLQTDNLSFISLNNLNVYINNNNNNSNNQVCSNLNRNFTALDFSASYIRDSNNFDFVSCSKPKAVIIHPSTPSTSPDSPIKSNEIFFPIHSVEDFKIIQYNKILNNYVLIANNSHINRSSSDTNLICTNQTQMLLTTPFPSCLKKQLRSSSYASGTGTSSLSTATNSATTVISPGNTATEGTEVMDITSLPEKASKLVTDSNLNGSSTPSNHQRTESAVTKITSPKCDNMISSKNIEIGRRSSDSDLNTSTPKGNATCTASERLIAATTLMRLSTPPIKTVNSENLDMMEYPFLTIEKYPPGFILHLGATVCARSVKLLERVPNPDEPETRDSWWTELRMEIRSHARALGCNVILGYSEVTTISDDVCVLSATGTATVINMTYSNETAQFDFSSPAMQSAKKDIMVSSLEEREGFRNADLKANFINKESIPDPLKECSSSFTNSSKYSQPNVNISNRGCSICHSPYTTQTVPFNVKLRKCALCKRGKVPDVLIATIELPEFLQITGRGCFMQAQVVRAKKDLRSESNAKEISDGLPFLEYELHRLLINKLRSKGMNAIFGLKAHVAIGERVMALVATGTAVYLTALPKPYLPKLVAGNSWTDTARLNDLQKSLQETLERNREIYQLKSIDPDTPISRQQSDTDDSEDELLDLDLTAGNKNTCVLEVDDIEDLEIISLLVEQCPPEGFHVVNTQFVPGLQDMEVVKNLQMFTQIWRAKIAVGTNVSGFPKHFQRLLQTIYFKLRMMIPCAICDLKFRLDLPESDEIQILVTGMALGLGEPGKLAKLRRKTIFNHRSTNSNDSVKSELNKKSENDELMFNLDEDNPMEGINNGQPSVIQTATTISNFNYGSHSLKLKKNPQARTKITERTLRHMPPNDRYGVDITPLSYIPGGKIEKYLGNLNFFFIRESTSIRENGGISGFVHSFITEILGVVRAHITALGGNAMLSFYMTQLLLVDNQHKNQGQCLISVGGDVVSVSYFTDE